MVTRISFFLMVGALALATPSAAQAPPAGDTLSLDEVYALVDAHNPMLAAARARTDASRSMESSAALPPDPELRLGVMNAALPGLEMDMPSSMAPSVEMMQRLPFPGKLGASGDIALAETAMAHAEAMETAWLVRVRAAEAFFAIHAADRQLESMRATLDLLEDAEDVARSLYASGAGRQADALRASVEVARMRAEIERVAARREVAAARLNGVLDRPADTVIPAVRAPGPDLAVPPAETLRGWATGTRPLLERAALAVEQARSRSDLARREIWPDLSLGVQYGQRPSAAGTDRMGSLMIGVSVPVFARQRQLRSREAAAAMERVAEAELADARSRVHARIGELLAELNRARTLMALYRAEVLPQARVAAESALSSYRVGVVDFMTVVDARMTVNEYEQELYQLEAEHGQLVAELEMTVGRALPRSPELAKEDR